MLDARTPPRFHVRMPSAFARFPRKLKGIAMMAVLALLPLFLVRGCMITYVGPDEIALRQISFGPGKGLQKALVKPGYRRQMFGYEKVYPFPRNMQILEFTNSEEERARADRKLTAINVPTVDGYPVQIDVTVLYRIADPYLVVSKFGFGRGYEDNVVIRFTDPIVKKHLGGLKAEEFYGDRRLVQAAALKQELGQLFKVNGIELSDILVRQYDYPETFQSLTEQKKIQDQSVLANRALAKQAEVDTRLKQIVQEGRNQRAVKTAEFEAIITDINAQRDLYERQRRAEADLLVRSAEADGTEMINRAMEGPGSDKLLRLRKGLALLNSIRGPIYITEDPTDLTRIMR